MKKQFKKGDRIQLSPKGRASFIKPDRHGTVTRNQVRDLVYLVWDKTVTETSFHEYFIELAP